jgi:hypothetical protein
MSRMAAVEELSYRPSRVCRNAGQRDAVFTVMFAGLKNSLERRQFLSKEFSSQT